MSAPGGAMGRKLFRRRGGRRGDRGGGREGRPGHQGASIVLVLVFVDALPCDPRGRSGQPACHFGTPALRCVRDRRLLGGGMTVG